VGADGKGTILFYSPHLSLNKAMSNGLTFGNGTAVIIHANEDDYTTQPAGNSGARIACGAVKLAQP
jgi:Cu-Zn family superoxide dismutase